MADVTPLDPQTVRESFRLIRSQTPPIIHELVDTLEARLLLDESMLAMQARIDRLIYDMLPAPDGVAPPARVSADTDSASVGSVDGAGAEIHAFPSPGHSVRVPSAWEADARSVSLPDIGGLTLGDPRIDTLREEGLA